MPRILSRLLPTSAPHISQAFDQRVEYDGVRIAALAEVRARDGMRSAVRAPIEDAIGVEDADAEVAFEVLEESEHAIDRTAGRLAGAIDGDDEKAALNHIATRNDRRAMSRPAGQKLVDATQQFSCRRVIQSWRNAEDPDPRVVGQLRNIGSRHVDYTPFVSFAKLMQRFKGGMTAEPHDEQDPLHLATAAVLLEVAHADGEFSPAEDGNIGGYLGDAFALNNQAAQELLKAADELRTQTIDHFALTNFIRKNASLADRIEMVKTMWRIVYSDRKLTDYENYLVRKIADLLGLEHRVMIDAKVEVLRELGIAT